MLCKYKNTLGEPKKGIHAIRVYNVAIIDVISTIVGAYIINYMINILNKKSKIKSKDIIRNIYESFNKRFIKILITIFVVGIILHRLFCVRTTIDKLLFNK